MNGAAKNQPASRMAANHADQDRNSSVSVIRTKMTCAQCISEGTAAPVMIATASAMSTDFGSRTAIRLPSRCALSRLRPQESARISDPANCLKQQMRHIALPSELRGNSFIAGRSAHDPAINQTGVEPVAAMDRLPDMPPFQRSRERSDALLPRSMAVEKF